MEDWGLISTHPHAAEAVVGSGLGASFAGVFRRGMKPWERVVWTFISFGIGVLFGGYVASQWQVPVGLGAFGVGSLGLIVAFGVLRAAERFDFTEVLKAMLGMRGK